MDVPFADRAEAGDDLALALRPLRLERPLVLGVPRGGVAVAAPVADALGAELDVIVVRKLGAPGNPELGIGAVGAEGDAWIDRGLVERLRVDAPFIQREIAEQQSEARRRVAAYRVDRPPLEVRDRDVVVVDDGIATGGTVLAAGHLLRAHGPRRLVLAVPVGPREGVERLSEAFDEVVCPHRPAPYYAVGQWYRDFHQVTDEEVRSLLGGRGGKADESVG